MEIDNVGEDFPPYPDTELALMRANPSNWLARKTALWLSCDIDEDVTGISAFYTPLSVADPYQLEAEWISQVSSDPNLSSHTAQFIPIFRLVSFPYQNIQWSTVQYLNKDPTLVDVQGEGAKYKCGLSSNIVFGEEEADGYIPMDVLYI